MTGKKLFGTDGIRGVANRYPMTAEVALSLGKALASVLIKRNKDKKRHVIVVGKDTRLSGYMLESALESGIVSMGVDVYLVGPLPTPAIARLIRSLNADAGIVISASHNPACDNGIKIFDGNGYKLSDEDEKGIEDLIIENKTHTLSVNSLEIGKAYRVSEALGRYIEFAKATVGATSLEGIKLVLDCANGAAYSVAPKIFEELGAEVISIGVSPNGLNINQGVGATDIKKLSETVMSTRADAGIALDGDADRIIMCDELGKEISGDAIIGILAKMLKEEGALKQNKVVVTIMSNLGLKKYLDSLGIEYLETAVGDKYVIEAMRNNSLVLGGEQSGHIIMSNYVTTGDGIITGLQVLKKLKESGTKMSLLASQIQKYPQVLLNIKVREKIPIPELAANNIIKKVEEELKNTGRVLVRYSGTENLCRVMVEAETDKEAREYSKKIAEEIKREIGD
jgi:phosphoglucosamine mutase